MHNRLGNTTEGIADYSSVIEMADAPVKQVTQALISRGVTQGQLGNINEAIADYSSVIDMTGAPEDQIADAFYNRANAHLLQGKNAKATEGYTAAIELDGASDQTVSWASYALAVNALQRDDWAEAFDLLHSVRVSTDKRFRQWFGEDSSAFIRSIFLSGQNANAWLPKLDQLVEIYADNDLLVELATGLVLGISELDYSAISPVGLSAWSGLWEEYAKTYPEFEISARLLKTGIVYLTSDKDNTALLELPEEERRLLSQALGLEPMTNKEWS